MYISMQLLQPLIALAAGVTVLLFPRILNYVIGIYLVLIGVLGLLPHIG
ncbi:DUF3096 domain-containing protein [Algihabitans albus]|nr:DUF3096 domain-containing protein [Algihabitans albus]